MDGWRREGWMDIFPCRIHPDRQTDRIYGSRPWGTVLCRPPCPHIPSGGPEPTFL